MKKINLKDFEIPLTWFLSIILIIVFVYNGWNYQKNLSIPFESAERDKNWKTENWNYQVRFDENKLNHFEYIDTIDFIDSNSLFQDTSKKLIEKQLTEYISEVEVMKSDIELDVIELIPAGDMTESNSEENVLESNSEENVLESITEEDIDYSLDLEVIDSIKIYDKDMAQEEPVKPVLKDFRNSSEYQKALRKYYKAIE